MKKKTKKTKKQKNFFLLTLVGVFALLIGTLAFFVATMYSGGSVPSSAYLMICIAILIALFGFIYGLYVLDGKIKPEEPDYKTLFILGITWFPLGVALQNPAFYTVGMVFIILGLINRDKWKSTPAWETMSAEKKRMKMAFLLILALLFIVGVSLYLMTLSVR